MHEMMQAFIVPMQPGETLESISYEEVGARMNEQLAPLVGRLGALAAEASEPRIIYAVYDSSLTLADVGLEGFEPDKNTSPAASLDFLKYALAKPVFEGDREEYEAYLAKVHILEEQARTAKKTEEDEEDEVSAMLISEVDLFLDGLFSRSKELATAA